MDDVPGVVQTALQTLGERQPERSDWDLGGWLQRWESLVWQIGAYRGSIADEYMNDLAARDEVYRILSLANDHGLVDILAWAIPQLDVIDQQFWQKPTPDTDGLMWGLYLEPHAWWRRRLPNDAGLMAHFQTVGPEMRGFGYPSL